MNLQMNVLKGSEADLFILPVFNDTCISCSTMSELVLEPAVKAERFKGEIGELLIVPVLWEGQLKSALLVGLGAPESVNAEIVRANMGKAWKQAMSLKAKNILVDVLAGYGERFEVLMRGLLEGIGMAQYKFDKYKTDQKVFEAPVVSLSVGNEAAAAQAAEILPEVEALVEGTCLARELVNEPANTIYPETLAACAAEAGRRHGFEVEIKEGSDLDELKMEAFLAVGQGSEQAPRLIIMRHKGNPDQPEQVLGLVGKGLTYDSGGYALKPADSMVNMKNDMGGSAAVIGAMTAIAAQKLPVNVTAVVAACENMISGGAYKNGDIIQSMAGKSIEIINTDAEGRLTLADAVTYIIRNEGASKVLDIATLTGAALVALGTGISPVVSNDDAFYSQLEAAAKISGEKFWRLPADSDYRKLIVSDVADLKNSGGRYAGTITAGMFIGEFVEGKPWLHLDIAGPAWADSDRDYGPKGGTGFGVRTLYHLAKLEGENL